MMAGAIDKQMDPSYQLAQDFGCSKQYGLFVSNGLATEADYIAELAPDTGQCLPDGRMPAGGPETLLAVDKLADNVTGPVNLSATYADQYVVAAHKLEGFTKKARKPIRRDRLAGPGRVDSPALSSRTRTCTHPLSTMKALSRRPGR